MRVFCYGLGLTLALSLGLGLGGGCSATGSKASSLGLGGSGAGSTGTGNSGIGGSMLTGTGGSDLADADVPDGLGACTTFTAQAQQAPAAMLILLQASSSMNLSNKWPAAQQAVVQAIDADVFDTMSLGMMTFPTQTLVTGPACIFGLPVACGTSGLPQVPVVPAGTAKSSASSGVRHDIYQYLLANGPIPEATDPGNATPLYDAMNNAYTALKGVSGVTKRILAVITDGGGSCTSLSQPLRPNIPDGNDCPDWEVPTNISTMIGAAQTDATTPVDTFVVGVPGSNSTGQSVPFPGLGDYDTAPYHMLLALSTYAVAGSPTTVDPTCDSAAVWTATGGDPAVPCHIDLSNGNNFNAAALANAITTLRGKALGCAYDLPAPPPGQTIDPTKVNVVVTINGTSSTIPKRSNPADTCLTGMGCWDYDANQKVDLIGAACSEVSTETSATVNIYVGCATILQ
jgi:hypothetical protein